MVNTYYIIACELCSVLLVGAMTVFVLVFYIHSGRSMPMSIEHCTNDGCDFYMLNSTLMYDAMSVIY